MKAHAKDDGGASLGGTSKCAQRVFTITVRAVNDAQVAREDSYKVSEDQTLTVRASGVLKNDSDIDDDRPRAQAVAKPKHGTLTLSLDGSFVYRPAKDYSGGDRFTYSVSDGHGAEDRATVAVTVGALPEPPDSGGRGCTIIGTGGRDVICGLGGNDVLDGGAGKDETIH